MKTVGYIDSTNAPSDPGDQAATSIYGRWRAAKLRDSPAAAGAIMVEIADSGAAGLPDRVL